MEVGSRRIGQIEALALLPEAALEVIREYRLGERRIRSLLFLREEPERLAAALRCVAEHGLDRHATERLAEACRSQPRTPPARLLERLLSDS